MAFTYDRRKFIKQGLRAGTIARMGPSSVYQVFSMNRNKIRATSYNLVAVRGGEPDMMFDKGIEALVGINIFVQKGQSVVIKSNIGWDAVSERAATTHPKLITRIIHPYFSTGACEYPSPLRLWKAIYVEGNPRHPVSENPFRRKLKKWSVARKNFPFNTDQFKILSGLMVIFNTIYINLNIQFFIYGSGTFFYNPDDKCHNRKFKEQVCQVFDLFAVSSFHFFS